MAQSDYELAAHISGLNQRTEINSIFDSILTHNSGSTAPTVTKAFMMWVDTSNATYYYLKMRNHDNTAWITLFIYTVATKVITPFIINSPTTNAIPKINADGTIGNSNIINDANGNTGFGVPPSVWYSSSKAIDIGFAGIEASTNLNLLDITTNQYINSSGNNIYKQAGYASSYRQLDGVHRWRIAPSGTAGNAISWTNAMTLDASGNLLVSGLSTGYSYFKKPANDNNAVLAIGNLDGLGYWSGVFNATSAGGANAAGGALSLGKTSNGRSVSAGGTINASGADYAEYEYSNDITIAKGQIVGFKVDGTLTDKYSEAIRFAIKSTNPSIVGGDTWGIENIVSKRPEQPVRKVDKTEQVQVEDSEEFETVVIETGDTDAEWEAIEAKYKEDLADFEARLETERQKVDRIAYAGKVPVNVLGATAGQYIVAIEKDGGIDGLAVNKADMTFAQYQDVVGRVNKILDDGRAEVAVIIH